LARDSSPGYSGIDVASALRRKLKRIAAYSAVSLIGLILVVLAGAMIFVQGPRLAAIVNGVLPEMKGRIQFGSIRWQPRLLWDLVTDRATPMAVEGLKITDPEGTTVLDVPNLEVAVRLGPLLGGGGIILSDLKVGPRSVWLFGKMKKQNGIGFLSSFDPKKAPPPTPPKPPGAKKEKGFVFQIVNAELDGFRAIFDFPGVWGLDLRDIHAPAALLVDGEGFVGWDVIGLEARKGGYLRVMTEELPFDQVLVNRVATTREWSDDIFLDLKLAKTGKSDLVGKGFFTGIYGASSVGGIKIHAEFEHAVDALTAVAQPHNIAGLRLSGENAKVVGDLWDPYDTLKIKATISGLDAAYDTYQAKDVALRAGIVFATTAPTMTIKVEELSLGSPSGGRFRTGLTMAGDDITAALDFDRFGTEGYLPESMTKLAAGKLQGHIGLSANIGPDKSVEVKGLDLRYDRSYKQNGIPSTVRITGQAKASAEAASTSGLHIAIPGATADIKGKAQLAKKLVEVGLRVSASDLPKLLASAKAPPLAKSATVAVDLSGSMEHPNASGQIDVRGIGGGKSGIPAIDQFQTGFRLRDGTLSIEGLRAGVAGGQIEGSGSTKLFERDVGKMLSAPALDFRLDGRQISLQELIAGGVVSGQVSFSLAASGTAKKPKIHFEVPAGATVEVLGQPWLLQGIDLEIDKDALVVKLCHVAAKAGGDVRVEGRVDLRKKPIGIDWHVKILDLSIGAMLAAAKVDVPASGRIDINLHVGGTVAAPAVDGTLALSRVRAFDLDLGKATLALAPTADGGVAVTGTLFDRFKLEGDAKVDPKGVTAKALLSFAELHVEDLVPDLKEQDIAAVLSGQVRLDLVPNHLPAIDVLVTQIDASIVRPMEQEDGSMAKERIWLRNANSLHVSTDTQKVVVEQARLLTQGGEFTLSAQLDPIKDAKGEVIDQAVSAGFAGKLDLELLQPLLSGKFSSLGGGVGLEVRAGGSVKKPDLVGKIGIVRPVRAAMRGFDPVVLVPSGDVRLTSSFVALDNLAVSIGDASMRVSGKVNLGPGFTPEALAVTADGDVNANLLETLAPDAVSDVSGQASISAKVSGRLDDPQIAAHITLGEIDMRLRGISRRVSVRSGDVDLSTHELLLHNVRVVLDDEGELLIGKKGVRPGRVKIRKLRPEFVWESVDLPLAGNRLSYRDGGTQIDDLSLTMELKGTPDTGLSLAGDVRLVSGRYLQDFNVRDMVLSPRINESYKKPAWEGQSMLGDIALNLRVRTEGDGFVVQNNLAPEIHVLIDLGIGGSLSAPAISGEIRPTDGRFHIIGLRGDFELSPNVNHVTFVPTKSIAAGDTPELNLEAQNTVPDATGGEHTVIMRINGPINMATIDLSTTDGLDRNQTMLLLLSGRTTDDISGNGGQLFGMNRQSGLDVIGQFSRDTVSNLIEPYIDDTLQLLTGHKLNLRPTVGADGFELKVQAQSTRVFNLQLSYLRGFQNQERYSAKGLTWFRDYLTGQVTAERLSYFQQGLPIQTNNLKLELTVEYPIRGLFPLLDSLHF
jgi:autotransporter translocation and assembly factor TamB